MRCQFCNFIMIPTGEYHYCWWCPHGVRTTKSKKHKNTHFFFKYKKKEYQAMYHYDETGETFLISPYPSYNHQTFEQYPNIIRVKFIPNITPRNIRKKMPTILVFS